MLSRFQKPTLRDFLLAHAQTRTHLCMDQEIFDPCEKLSELTSFEKATLKSWSADSNVDSGLNLYILLHFLSAINKNSYYYHYVNNGNPDGTNMFGHIIGTSGSGKSSALTPHLDALGHTLTQMNINEEYVQHPSKNNDLSFEQPFIISNATSLHVYRSLMYGNRLLCSTECDTLLSNLGVYGNQYNDPRFAENVNMLIQMFDGTKHQNRSTLSTSYNIPEGRRASIIGASVGDPYARVSQQHYEGNGISGAHNRFTHYPCPITKAIKTNAGSTGVISNMIPSLQHVYTVSILLEKVEYVARQNVYDKSQRKETRIFDSDIEEKWKRLRPTDNREYCLSPSQIEVELEELETDATFEQSKSAFYYMFNRVYSQWQEATLTEKQEHEAIINLKNSTKIPRFICNFARFRAIMNILWDDSVYPHIEISEVSRPPYRVSNSFIDAVKSTIDKHFPPNLHKNDGTKILVIEKPTAVMGDLFFAHVDQVSRQLFDLSSIQEKFNASPTTSNLLPKNPSASENGGNHGSVYDDANFIILSKFIFFSPSMFTQHGQFHNKKARWITAIQFLIDNELIYQASSNDRFIKGTRTSFAMATPNQLKKKKLSLEALTKLKLNIDDYEQLWHQCILPAPELSSKLDKSALDHINLHLSDYISIIHRLGNANDPVAQVILKTGLYTGQIGIDFNSNTFSLAPEHIIRFDNVDDVMKQLNGLCIRANDQTIGLYNNTDTSILDDYCLVSKTTGKIEASIPRAINDYQLEAQQSLSMIDCMSVLEKIISILENDSININHHIQNDAAPIRQWLYDNQKNHKSSTTANDLTQILSNDTRSYGMPTIGTKNNETKTTDSFISIEYDDPTTYYMSINDVEHSLPNQQQSPMKSFPELSSSISIDYENGKESTNISSDSMEIDSDSHFQTSSTPETISHEYDNASKNLKEMSNEESTLPVKTHDYIRLSKKILCKPFIIFTQTDATRLYNNAETKNVVIEYLKEHGLIKQIEDLFFSTSPSKRTYKPEIGYLKLFPVSRSASKTSSFEEKLREKVGITFDDYVGKVFNSENSSASNSIVNNVFNKAYHKWLLNRYWYEKLQEGHTSVYYQNNILCPDADMSLTMVTVAPVSNDNVHDAFDRPRPKLTSSQRTNKELRRLGIKRQKESGDDPPPKRQRKPKRFADDE